MLYKTHKKFGYLFGWTGLLIAFLTGSILTMTSVSSIMDKLFVFIVSYTAIRAAVFGACFPDIDSKGSVPARHYPFLRRLFSSFNIKHRGKVSHDYFSIFLIFTGYYMVISILVSKATTIPILAKGLTVFLFYILARDIVNHTFFYLYKNAKKRRSMIRIGKPIVTVILIMVFTVLGYVNMGDRTVDIVRTLNFVGPLLKVWIVFGWVGATSHLFADMLTNEGVWFFGKRLAPAQVVLVVRKLPIIGKALLKSEMKTGSEYEDAWSVVVSVLIIPIGLLAVIAMFGGDVGQIMTLIGVK